MHVLEIRDVIAHVDLWTLIMRTNPDDIHSKVFNIVELAYDAGDVAHAIVVAVFEAGGIDLVDDCFFPPPAFVLTPYHFGS
jgi:hypothetical protein